MTRRFKDNPTAKYKEAVRVLRELIEAEGGDTASRACAEAMAHEERRWYAEKHHRVWTDKDVKLTEREISHVCIHRLKGAKRCPDSYKNPCGMNLPQLPCADHLSEWHAGGKTMTIVSQPYGGLDLDAMREIINFCELNGLQADVSAGSWHFLGHTLRIEYSRQKEGRR